MRRWEWPDPGDATKVRDAYGGFWGRQPGEPRWYDLDERNFVSDMRFFVELVSEFGPLVEVPDG